MRIRDVADFRFMLMELPYSLLPSGHMVGKSLPFLTAKLPDIPLFGGNPHRVALASRQLTCVSKSRGTHIPAPW